MARVRTNFKQSKRDIKRFKTQARAEAEIVMKKEITESIERGVSPVKGFGRFVKYSQAYLKQIKNGRFSGLNKKRRPVNLKLTGQLLRSLKITATKLGLKISFDNKLADIHNRKGAGKSKTVRRILPTKKGEQFSRSITMRLKEVLNRVAKNIFKE